MKKTTFILLLLCFIADQVFSYSVNVSYAILPFIVPLAMAGVSAAGSALGSSKAAREMTKNEKIIGEMKDDAQKEYLNSYYRSSLDNPGAQSYLKRLDRTMRDNTKAVENTATATGATQENVLAAKESNNRVMSDAVGDLVQRDEQNKDMARERYIQRKAGIAGQQMGMNQQKAQNWANLGQNISSAAGSLAQAYLMSGTNSLISKPGAGPNYSIAAGGPGHSPEYKANFIKNIGK